MNDSMWELIKTILIALVSSGSVTAVITRYFDKHSRVSSMEEQLTDIVKVLNRQGEAIQALVQCQMELLNILHEKKVINGESQKLRDTFAGYMYESQGKGFKVKEKKA